MEPFYRKRSPSKRIVCLKYMIVALWSPSTEKRAKVEGYSLSVVYDSGNVEPFYRERSPSKRIVCLWYMIVLLGSLLQGKEPQYKDSLSVVYVSVTVEHFYRERSPSRRTVCKWYIKGVL